jgi:mRNA-degrading endonuclease RelE of RelBE toxin-antitoxin system
MNVRFHRLADHEARDARRWYERRRLGLGDDFVTELERAVARIIAAPDRPRLFAGRFRSARLRRFPYRLIYEIIDAATVQVVAVAHDWRRPGYWSRRAAPG